MIAQTTYTPVQTGAMNSAKVFDQSTALPPIQPAHLQVRHIGQKLPLGHLIHVLSPQITHEEKAKRTPKQAIPSPQAVLSHPNPLN